MQKLILFILTIVLFSSCALHNGLTSNLNNHNTEVVLTKKNFKVIQRVYGEAEVDYVLGIGGLKRQALIAEARQRMLTNAGLEGTSRAVINETVEVRKSFFPFAKSVKVVVSAYVIEFTE